MEFAGYLGVLVAGMSLGLIGGGGSILVLPILLYLFHITPTLATTYSLFVVGLASIIGVIQYLRSKEIHIPLGLSFLFPSVLGVLFSRLLLVPSVPSELFRIGELRVGKDLFILIVFAIMMLTVSVSMIRRAKRVQRTVSSSAEPSRLSFVIKSFGVGVLTGFVGAGGGFLIVPALVILGNLSMKTAVGTSLFIISINSLIGFVSDFRIFSELNWKFLLAIALVMSIGIVLGKVLSRKVSSQKLEPAFGWFVLVVGIFILLKQLIVALA